MILHPVIWVAITLLTLLEAIDLIEDLDSLLIWREYKKRIRERPPDPNSIAAYLQKQTTPARRLPPVNYLPLTHKCPRCHKVETSTTGTIGHQCWTNGIGTVFVASLPIAV